jgi:hypothetical protein
MPSEEARLQVDLAEFSALRAEIQTFLTLQGVLLYLAVAAMGAIIPVAVGKELGVRHWIAAAAPLAFTILAALYADIVARIARAATYINRTLRPGLTTLAATDAALGWEDYVHKRDPHANFLEWSDRVRYAVFAVPAVAAFFGFGWWQICGWRQQPSPWHWWGPVLDAADIGAFFVACKVVKRSEKMKKEIHPVQPTKHA